MKELIRFNYDAKEITINTELLKKIFFGSNKEAIKWLVQSINSQNVNNEVANRWNKKLENPSIQYNFASIGEDFISEPICFDPKFAPDFARWLNNIELPEEDKDE